MSAGVRASGYAGPGDVGRRVAQRRHELGLTRAQLATRAGTALEYLEYIETRPGHPSAETLLRVAQALRTDSGPGRRPKGRTAGPGRPRT